MSTHSAADHGPGSVAPALWYHGPMSAPQPTAPAVRDANDDTRTIGRYRVLDLVGRGGFGEVHAAHDPELDRRVALKILTRTEDHAAVARLRREATTMARLSHPNVARVFDVGEVDGNLFIAMEFIRGATLRTWLSGQLRTWPEIRAVFLAAGQGLAAAHREGIVHRDFKPENVIIDEEGRARVVDFGLAAATMEGRDGGEVALPAHTADEDELVETTQPSDPAQGGTPAYMAPELHLGRPADARSDQYSFCVALFEALHGRRPFPGRTWQTLSPQVLRAARELPPGRAVPPHLRRAVDRGLAAAPERRFPDMDALLRELVRDPVPRGARHYLALGTGLSALASLVALSVWLARPGSDAAPAPSTTPADACARDPGRCTTQTADARVEALSDQLELARALRRDRRPTQALELLAALADAAREALGAGHELHRVIERERDALADELQRPAAAHDSTR